MTASSIDTRTASPARSMALDVLRGVAIVLVLLFHAPAGHPQSLPVAVVWLIFNRTGWSGVDLFFVLSGFLVGGLLLSELKKRDSVDASRFMLRRIFKIWPAYYCMLVALLGIQGGFTAAGFQSLLPNFLHYQNYTASGGGFTWSLAVEEHFYLVLPLLIAFLCRRKTVELGSKPGSLEPCSREADCDVGHAGESQAIVATLPVVLLSVMAVCPLLRCIYWFVLNDHNAINYGQTHLRIDSLAAGVMLSYISVFRPQLVAAIRAKRWLLPVYGTALVSWLVVVPSNSPIVLTIGLSILYVGYGCFLMFAATHSPGGGVKRWSMPGVGPAMAFIGRYSYSIYIWHMFFSEQFIRVYSAATAGLNADVAWCLGVVAYVSFASVTGIVGGKLIEFPFIALRDKVVPSRSGQALQAAYAVAGHNN